MRQLRLIVSRAVLFCAATPLACFCGSRIALGQQDAPGGAAAVAAAHGAALPAYGSSQANLSSQAVELDREGRLAEALPLYHWQAQNSRTDADRLRYADALMRAGREDAARRVLDAVAGRPGGHEGARGQSFSQALCASVLLKDGFPQAALEYAKRAFNSDPHNPAKALLLIRAECASGNFADARRTIDRLWQEQRRLPYGQRLELARWMLRIGDQTRAQTILKEEPDSLLARMFHYSVLADTAMRNNDWKAAEHELKAAEEKEHPGLEGERVALEWRNARREAWSIRLRRAVSLWKLGRLDEALSEAERGLSSDEEYVHAASTLMLVGAELAKGKRDRSPKLLKALSGHDSRFDAPVELLAASSGQRETTPAALSALREALGREDRSASFVTHALFDLLSESTAGALAARDAAAPALR